MMKKQQPNYYKSLKKNIMSKLSGKAKEEFDKWYYKEDNGLLYNLDEIPDIYENALIIEWFDSVQIFISINYVNFINELTSAKGFEAMVTNKHITTRFIEVNTRTEATTKAIEKANDLYNNLNQ